MFDRMMKRMIYMLATLTALAIAGSAEAACFADYKAKRDKPLRLHYGVIELPDAVCGDVSRTEEAVAQRLAAGNWRLLNVLSVFAAEGLEDKKDSAGEFFLRF